MPIGIDNSRAPRCKSAAGLILSALVLMGTDWYSDHYAQCRDGTTTDIVQCLDRLAAQWQARLDDAYEKLLAAQNTPERKAALEQSQRRWEAYRRANCLFYRQGPGSIAAIEGAECVRALTQRRARELEQAARQEPD